jgi:hypothetical protein
MEMFDQAKEEVGGVGTCIGVIDFYDLEELSRTGVSRIASSSYKLNTQIHTHLTFHTVRTFLNARSLHRDLRAHPIKVTNTKKSDKLTLSALVNPLNTHSLTSEGLLIEQALA